MLQYPTDVVESRVREPAIAVTRENVVAVLSQRLMHMRAVAVVIDERLGHKRGRFTVAVRDVHDHVFENLYAVSLLHERIESDADLALPAGGYLVMMNLRRKPHLLQCQAHCRADIV